MTNMTIKGMTTISMIVIDMKMVLSHPPTLQNPKKTQNNHL